MTGSLRASAHAKINHTGTKQMEPTSFELIEYQKEYESLLIAFLEQCLPESHRYLELNGRHRYYLHIAEHFVGFWCLFDGSNLIGTVAVSELDSERCELKSLYLSERYHGMGLGKKMLLYAIHQAKKLGYQKMFLDSLSTSANAIALYRKAGFMDTEKYNSSAYSDVFMVLDLSSD